MSHGERSRRFDLLRAQRGGFHGERFHHDVREVHDEFLLFVEFRAMLRVGGVKSEEQSGFGVADGRAIGLRFCREQIVEPSRGALQRHARRNEAVDFVRAFKEAVDAESR